MTASPIVTGVDRFIARRWADYALDLLIAADPSEDEYTRLKVWLEQEIKGKESSRKTTNQIYRLWLNKKDKYQYLRDRTIQTGAAEMMTFRPILHLGMAINVFPLFREVCGVVGRLTGLQGVCSRQETCRRVLEKYGNPTSIPRTVDRVFQTLVDWGFMEKSGKVFKNKRIELANPLLAGWFLESLLFTQLSQQMTLTDLLTMPEQLGVQVNREREVIRENPNLFVIRDGTANERVGLMVG